MPSLGPKDLKYSSSLPLYSYQPELVSWTAIPCSRVSRAFLKRRHTWLLVAAGGGERPKLVPPPGGGGKLMPVPPDAGNDERNPELLAGFFIAILHPNADIDHHDHLKLEIACKMHSLEQHAGRTQHLARN